MTKRSFSIFLIEKSNEARSLLMRYLEANDQFQVVGEASDHAEAVADILAARPDVVIVDRLLDDEEGALAAAVSESGSRLILHSATVPTLPDRSGIFVHVDAVVFKEVGMLGELVEVISSFEGLPRE